MKLIRAIGQALKLIKEEEQVSRLNGLLTDDPISVELIRKIAKEYDYHFEIVQKDGTVLRFKKAGVSTAVDRAEGDVW